MAFCRSGLDLSIPFTLFGWIEGGITKEVAMEKKDERKMTEASHKRPESETHHFILPDKMAFGIGGILLILTFITVWVAGFDFGRFNFFIAILIACIKALLVALFFMTLKYDRRENNVIFFSSFVFLMIFLVLTASDLLFRGEVYVKGPLLAQGGPHAASSFHVKKAWISTPELIAKGKEEYQKNCASCHGVNGGGDGSAAAGLNPKPRNFTSLENWKNGRKSSQIFKTINNGIPGSSMSSFGYLPSSIKWALVHFVAQLGPTPQSDSDSDLAAVGVDPKKDELEQEKKATTIPIEMAMQALIQDTPAPLRIKQKFPEGYSIRSVAKKYQMRCAQCHGTHGEGNINFTGVGVQPFFRLTARSFLDNSGVLSDDSLFEKTVIQGIPGSIMPGFAFLNSREIKDLQIYIRSLVASRN